MKSSVVRLIIAICAAAVLPGAYSWGAGTVKVTASIVPQKYFVEKIGGEYVDITVMVLPGASPATYEPKPKQMISLANSSIYFAIGVPFEKVWLSRFAEINNRLLIVNTDEGIDKIPMVSHRHEKEMSIESGSKEKSRPDPHIWLSPELVRQQASNILKGLIAVDPDHENEYRKNCVRFVEEIDSLHNKIAGTLESGNARRDFIVFHPSWGYFARDYGLRQVPIEVEGKDLKPAQLMELIEFARHKKIKVIFVQPQFSTESAEVIAKEIDGKVIAINPLAENWAENLLKAARIFKEVLR